MRTTQHSNIISNVSNGIQSPIQSVNRNHREKSTELTLPVVVVSSYIIGIVLERLFSPGLLSIESQYYLEATSYSTYLSVFLRMVGATFFQLTVILFLGFHLLGSILSMFYCAVQGAIFGYFIAGIAYHGGKALAWFWLINGVFIICHALNFLRLCTMAKRSGSYLFCKTLNRNLPQSASHPPYRLKYLLIRYIFALVFSLLYSSIGALIAVIFAGVLL